MTEHKDTERATSQIEFQGRTLVIKAPEPEQILIWQRTVKALENADLDSWDGKQVLAALERTRTIIDTLLSDPDDIAWLDDEMLAGRVRMKEASEIVLEAVRKMASTKAPADRKPPVRRKAPAKKTPAKKTTGRKRT